MAAYRRLGSVDDGLVFEEGDVRFSIGVQRSRSRAWIFVGSHSATTSEVYCIPADQPSAALRLIAPRTPEHEYHVDHRGDLFYIVTNDRGRNFRLVSAPVSDPSPQNWTEVIPQREDVMLEDVELFARHAVVHERSGGFPGLRVMSFDTGEAHPVEFPEPAYSVYGTGNAEFDSDTFRFAYESLVTPDSVFDYNMNTRSRKLLKQEEVLGGYDSTRYASGDLRAERRRPVPVSMAGRKDRRPPGPQPLLLTGYGAYGFLRRALSSTRLSPLDRGVICHCARAAAADGRSGRGRMLAKKNTFTDFIAAGENHRPSLYPRASSSSRVARAGF
jgi:oligopeptidase B